MKFRFKKDSKVDDISLSLGEKQIVCQGRKAVFECTEAEWNFLSRLGYFEVAPESAPQPEPSSPNVAGAQ